jgi:hypothetical protein
VLKIVRVVTSVMVHFGVPAVIISNATHSGTKRFDNKTSRKFNKHCISPFRRVANFVSMSYGFEMSLRIRFRSFCSIVTTILHNVQNCDSYINIPSSQTCR